MSGFRVVFTWWIKHIKFRYIVGIFNMVAVCLGGFWGYTTYVKPEVWRPGDYKLHLSLDIKLESIEVLQDSAIVSLSFNVENQSKRLIRNLGTYYNMLALKEQKQKHGSEEKVCVKKNFAEKLNEDKIYDEGWYWGYERCMKNVISMGRVVPDIWWFTPKEKYAKRIVVSVPSDANLLHVTIDSIYYAADEGKFRIEWRITEGGLLSHKIDFREKPCCWVRYDEGNKEHKELGDNHGLSWTKSVSEIYINTGKN